MTAAIIRMRLHSWLRREMRLPMTSRSPSGIGIAIGVSPRRWSWPRSSRARMPSSTR